MNEEHQAGDIVYVMFRNPHAQDVATVQAAAVVENPEEPGKLCLFVYETFYPLDEETAVFKTAEEARQAYEDVYGRVDQGEFYG
ncbi:MAG: transcriptional regulator SplA domain-containing protein [Tuberibacillus sp.]